ncbi:HIT family protein [Denitratisoma oestradiolicum]|uniref:HIT family hydrolase n=1 Tax=Denitratisoma oestradiolicum TaxID=311182 RepID=A0A6S6Y267_9PROT|nr:HIT family protein [Denitratisoma oestradiolicum]TWO79138.1 HIT family protein [Denitratisoma oestradiolicum]CAB1371041.1 HIT family hydrolase [Denitratisoma oestradiolicum]
MNKADCDLCTHPGGELLWEDALCRVIRVEGPEGSAFPGFCRVVWHGHASEMSDLAPTEQRHLFNVVLATEIALRSLLAPDKINLASLGNVVPHLHWHVIPRWRDDSHFPAPIWAPASRPPPDRPAPTSAALRQALMQALAEVCNN